MRPPISSADLLRAFDALAPSNDEEKRAIAEVLGLEWRPPAEPPVEPQPVEAERPQQRTQPDRSTIVRPPVQESVPVTHPVGRDTGFTVTGPVKRDAGSLLWAKPGQEFEPEPPAGGIPASPAGRGVLPLFAPRWTRGILSTALAVRTPTGGVDIREVVLEIARGRLLRTLPRLSAPAMAQRVEVLVDAGPAMLPFRADQRNVIEAVRTVAGYDNVTVWKFAGSPSRGAGTDDMDEWPPYAFPTCKTHILLLSDLGIGRPPLNSNAGGVEEWRRFGRELHRRRIACTVLVPYPAKRWPAALLHQFHLVEWDRATTAGSVKFSRRPKT